MTYDEMVARVLELKLRIKALHKLYQHTDPNTMCYGWYIEEVSKLLKEQHELEGKIFVFEQWHNLTYEEVL